MNSKKDQEALLKAAKQMQIAIAPMIANIQATSKIMEPIFRAMESIHKNIMPSLKIMDHWQKSFIPIFDTIDFKKLTAKAKEMNTPAFKGFIKEWGWLFNKKSINLGDYCFGLYKKYGNKEFRNKVSRWFYHEENLNDVFKDIKKKFPERYQIIKEGFNFHAKKNYSCAITLLLPHTEGILWEFGIKKKYVKKGYNSGKKYKKYFTSDELLRLKNKNKWATWKIQDLSKNLFPNDKFHNIIVNNIFCDGFRNKILHGRNIYNKKEKEISRWNSTLLILTLWRLTDE